MLPDLSGRLTAEHIRTHHPESGVLYMSGYTDNEIVHNGVFDEGTPFLAEPFTVDTLLTQLRQSLSANDNGSRGVKLTQMSDKRQVH